MVAISFLDDEEHRFRFAFFKTKRNGDFVPGFLLEIHSDLSRHQNSTAFSAGFILEISFPFR